jgi:maltose alpha-D-glucosyltransferase/alpha-amylase
LPKIRSGRRCRSNWPVPGTPRTSGGLITDAFSLETFVRAVLQGMQSSTVLNSDRARSVSRRPRSWKNWASAESEVRYLSAEQSNSSVVIGNSLVLKLIRKVASGCTRNWK